MRVPVHMPETRGMVIVSPCQQLCDWAPVTAEASQAAYPLEPLFACAGCGSQWVRSERWTPRQADGTVPDAVRAERQRG